MRKSSLERWEDERRQKFGTTHINGVEDFIKLLVAGDKPIEERSVNPTQLAYILSDARFKAYPGPAGCAKTTTGCADVLFKALMLPGTKWFIARRDYNDLLDTTMRTFTRMLSWLPEGTILDRSKQPPMKLILRPIQVPALGIDARPSEITFMGLSDDVGSYEFNGGFIDECDEVERYYYEQMKGRMRYMPWPGYPENGYSIGVVFNPPDVNHWLYTACTGRDQTGEVVAEPTFQTFRPKPSENEHNLPKGYYAAMDSMPEDLRMRLRDGEWGATFPGAPVIPQFKRMLHVDPLIKPAGRTVFRAWDFGYNRPGCLVTQVSKDNRIEVVAELLGHKQEAKDFIPDVAKLTSEHFPNSTGIEDHGDPAVKQHKDTGSALTLLHSAGIQMRFQVTPLDLSLKILRSRFGSLIGGKPAITIHPRCRVLLGALAGGYHFKDDGVTPKKDGYYDHLVDCLRYLVWNLFGASLTTADASNLPNSVAHWSH